MPSQIVPLTTLPNQTLSVTLAINGGTLTLLLTQSFNRVGGFWVLNISTAQNVPLVNSLPLITGDWPAGNILGPYEYLGIGEAFVINSNGAASDFPNDSNLGSGFVLLWTDNSNSVVPPGYPTAPLVSGSGQWSSYPVSALSSIIN